MMYRYFVAKFHYLSKECNIRNGANFTQVLSRKGHKLAFHSSNYDTPTQSLHLTLKCTKYSLNPEPLVAPKISSMHLIRCKWTFCTDTSLSEDIFWPTSLKTLGFCNNSGTLYKHSDFARSFQLQKFWIINFDLNMRRFAPIFDHFQCCTDLYFVSLKALK